MKKFKQQRAEAVQRYLAGEDPESICVSLGRSSSWLYKWLARHVLEEESWFEDLSRRPLSSPHRTAAEIEQIVELVRWSLYNKNVFCGSEAIHWELDDMNVQPLPSVRTISRILHRLGLTHRRTGRYESKGKKYPTLPARVPNETQQLDFVGPCHLKGLRKYRLTKHSSIPTF